MDDPTRPLVTAPPLQADDRGDSVCCGSAEPCHDCPFYKPAGVGQHANGSWASDQPAWLHLTRDDDAPGADDR